MLCFIVTPNIILGCRPINKLEQGDNFVCECKGTDGNPPADVTWYKNNTKIGDTRKEKAILRFTSVYKDKSGTYSCEATSHEKAKNERSIELIVTSKCNWILVDLTRQQ